VPRQRGGGGWRIALRRAAPGATTVAAIATHCGFSELGRFSVTYRTRFGEAPAAALGRPPDDRQFAEIVGSLWEVTKTA
jgi:AraC-like DNA-binding protein